MNPEQAQKTIVETFRDKFDELDELVYALYGLTPDEIKLVERSAE